MDWYAVLNQIILVMIWICIAGSMAIAAALLHEKRKGSHQHQH